MDDQTVDVIQGLVDAGGETAAALTKLLIDYADHKARAQALEALADVHKAQLDELNRLRRHEHCDHDPIECTYYALVGRHQELTRERDRLERLACLQDALLRGEPPTDETMVKLRDEQVRLRDVLVEVREGLKLIADDDELAEEGPAFGLHAYRSRQQQAKHLLDRLDASGAADER